MPLNMGDGEGRGLLVRRGGFQAGLLPGGGEEQVWRRGQAIARSAAGLRGSCVSGSPGSGWRAAGRAGRPRAPAPGSSGCSAAAAQGKFLRPRRSWWLVLAGDLRSECHTRMTPVGKLGRDEKRLPWLARLASWISGKLQQELDALLQPHRVDQLRRHLPCVHEVQEIAEDVRLDVRGLQADTPTGRDKRTGCQWTSAVTQGIP